MFTVQMLASMDGWMDGWMEACSLASIQPRTSPLEFAASRVPKLPGASRHGGMLLEATLRCVWRMHGGPGLLGPRRRLKRRRAAGCSRSFSFLGCPFLRCWEGDLLNVKIGE